MSAEVERCPFVNTFRARHTDVILYHALRAFESILFWLFSQDLLLYFLYSGKHFSLFSLSLSAIVSLMSLLSHGGNFGCFTKERERDRDRLRQTDRQTDRDREFSNERDDNVLRWKTTTWGIPHRSSVAGASLTLSPSPQTQTQGQWIHSTTQPQSESSWWRSRTFTSP